MKNNQKENREKRPIKLQEKHKKLFVYTALSLLFIGVMYVLFAPDTHKKTGHTTNKGMNVSIPQATGAGLLDDKQSAYEQQQLVEEQERKRQAMASLSDLFQNDTIQKPMSKTNRHTPSSARNHIGASVSAYQNIHKTLDNFYTNETSQTKALQEEIEALKKQVASKNDVVNQEERQLALLEKSYQMASKYLPATTQETTVKGTPVQNGQHRKIQIKSVQQHQELVVSSLQNGRWNNGQSFNTVVGLVQETQRNTIKACVHQTMEIVQGESVPIRLLEPIQVANVVVPAQTIFTASPKLQGNRLLLTITSIQYRGLLVPVQLEVYDLDGQKGVLVPGTLEQNAVKEVLLSLGTASGTAFSLNNSASEQLLTDMGKGVLQGTSNYLKKKIQHIKIKVKAGHSVLLLSEIQ
ncbi:conjugative transposon protein TraM [uncultured Polaribacter sp.]|uniref:conjugative transposon protein TraM n=1 Tax=uncultured Polaribacter sp. TaxID=174711 RepID=UPI00263786B0|nr:conjugative transposon protein TraM [uncultured Polaribacter sp.]